MLHQWTGGFGWSTLVAVSCCQGVCGDIWLGWKVKILNSNIPVLMSLRVGGGCFDLVFFVTVMDFLGEVNVWIKVGIDVDGVMFLMF